MKKNIWEGVYQEKEHCHHCFDKGYKQGFFDAGVSGLMIIVVLILFYGVEMMK